ncbi:hypothetical protein F8S13_20000 [Chloroflexia bacterium SDU3-3]|nr:hypothetical protein F8S13_20000 [Chloroflexia bacterium SDU3-3]
MRTVIMSDIHIGDNYRTCWYQATVHEPYLLALLDYIIQNASGGPEPIGRLVILGDFFDFWTYPPAVVPPSIDQIIQANPNVLGPEGKLRQVLDALAGNVQYIHGNHDITLTQADLDRIPTGQHKIAMLPDITPDPSGLLLTHGHLATMFNAPDPRAPVPVGYYVTRVIAHLVEQELAPNQTAADLHNQGSPYGFSLASLIPSLSGQFSNPSITNLLIDYICERCGWDESGQIKLEGGASTTIAAIKPLYDGLWTNWARDNGGGEVGALIAAKAAQADYEGSYICWFAQKFAFERNQARAIMGHTHVPKVGIQHSACDYVNNGFECPSTPDISAGQTHWNFTEVAGDGTMSLRQVAHRNGSYLIEPASAPPDTIVYSPFMDFSCYISIVNNSGGDLTYQTQSASRGYFVFPPPKTIRAGTTARLWIQDLPGAYGAEGAVTYTDSQGKRWAFSFGCPTGFSPNYASGGACFVATSENPPMPGQKPSPSVPRTGHPLFVTFYLVYPS